MHDLGHPEFERECLLELFYLFPQAGGVIGQGRILLRARTVRHQHGRRLRSMGIDDAWYRPEILVSVWTLWTMRHAVHSRLLGACTRGASQRGISRHRKHHDCLGALLPIDGRNGMLFASRRIVLASLADQDGRAGQESLVSASFPPDSRNSLSTTDPYSFCSFES